MMLQVTLLSGKEAHFNLQNIISIVAPSEEKVGAYVNCTDGESYLVKETVQQLLQCIPV